MITYKLQNHYVTGKLNSIEKTDGNTRICIPLDEANTDYQEYLEWVAEGNTPEAAD